MSKWTLQTAGGAELPLDARHVTSAVLTELNQQTGGLTLTTVQPLEAAGFAYRADTLLLRDGARVFRGVMLEPELHGSAATEGRRYTVAGMGWFFDNLMAKARWAVPPPAGSGFAPGTGFVSLPKGFLFSQLTGQGLLPLSADLTVAELVGQVGLAGGPVEVGAVILGVTPLPQAWEMNTVGQLLSRVFALIPDAVSWWDVSGTGAKFNMTVAGALGVLTLEIGGADGCITEVLLSEARAQRLGSMTGRLHKAVATEDGSGFSADYGAGIVLTSGGVDPFSTMDVVMDDMGGLITEPDFHALLVSYFAATQAAAWRGTFDYTGRDGEPHALLRPGQRVNLTGGAPAWATMRALVQGVRTDILRGTSTVTVGPPKILGANDRLVTLLNNWRSMTLRTAEPDVMTEQATGISPDANTFGMGGKDNTKKSRRKKDCCSGSAGGG